MRAFQADIRGISRRLQSAALGCLLLHAAAPAQAAGSSGLDLAINEVFPEMHSEQLLPEAPRSMMLSQAAATPSSQSAWESAIPPAKEFDWLQTTSGEWLKGELKVLYSGKLEFDSDEFGLLTIDWDDVAQIRGHGTKRVSVDTADGPIALAGVVRVDKSKVTVDAEGATREFDRNQLISITPGAKTEWDNWSAKINLGANYSRGNSDQTDFTAMFNIKRRTPENRFVIDYLGNYSVSGGSQTANNHRLNAFFDIFAGRHFFWRPIFGEYFRDPFQNIDYRTTVGAGAGYTIIDTPDTTWDVTGGPAYRATRYVSVQPGDSQKVSTPALVAGTSYDTTLTKTVDFIGSYNFSIVNKESGTYTQHLIGTFEIELTSILDFNISFVWDRTQDPQPRSDGSVPKKDDYQLLLTLGVDI
jgi:Protein of unknown function, DUF481